MIYDNLTREESILEAFKQEDPLWTAEDLIDLGLAVLPVRATTDIENQKLPAVTRSDNGHNIYWSANNYIHKNNKNFKELENAFYTEKLGIAISLRAEDALLVIDADKPEEVEALKTWWNINCVGELPKPTVQSPGVYKNDTWKHSDGGHWYFTMPKNWHKDLTLKKYTSIKVEEVDSQFDIKIGGYIITPPTIRKEGQYKITGEVYNAEELGAFEHFKKELSKNKSYKLNTKKPKGFTDNRDVTIKMTNSTIQFNPSLSTEERILEWDSEQNWELIAPKYGFDILQNEGCGPECYRVSHPEGSQGNEGVIHSPGCNAFINSDMGILQHHAITIFSSSVKDYFNIEKDTVSLFEFIQYAQYNGDWEEAMKGEGLWRDKYYYYSLSPEDRKIYRQAMIDAGIWEERPRYKPF